MSRLRPLLVNLAIAAVAFLAVLFFLEWALRTFPVLLPKGSYGSSRYRPDFLTNVHGSKFIYNKARHVVRTPNSEGFLDIEWDRARASEALRIGFFGDSYVEAGQVPLAETFYRRLQESMLGEKVETFGFGISGWGTLHSAQAARVLAPRYDINVVVYVFVENDPGDNTYLIQIARKGRQSPKAYAASTSEAPGYSIRWVTAPDDLKWSYKIGKALQSRFLLVQAFWSRLQLLRAHGVELYADREAMLMEAEAMSVPNQNDLPSSWPEPYAAEARALTSAILEEWRNAMVREDRYFLILYVPRGESQLRGDLTVDETWFPWLREVAGKLDIPLIDPTDELSVQSRKGVAMYDDHWSPAGHSVVARVVERYLREHPEIVRSVRQLIRTRKGL